MRKILWVTCFLILAASCSKDDTDEKTSLIGKWKWVSSSGGINGRTENPENTGKQISLEFTYNTAKSYLHDSLTSNLKYRLIRGTSILSNKDVDMIHYESGGKVSYVVTDNRLFLSEECYDCFLSEYVKQ